MKMGRQGFPRLQTRGRPQGYAPTIDGFAFRGLCVEIRQKDVFTQHISCILSCIGSVSFGAYLSLR